MCWGDTLKYDEVPWEKWETALEQTVSFDKVIEIAESQNSQLKLF